MTPTLRTYQLAFRISGNAGYGEIRIRAVSEVEACERFAHRLSGTLETFEIQSIEIVEEVELCIETRQTQPI